MPAARRELPSSYEEAARLLESAAADHRRVRFVGGATKLSWGVPVEDVSVEVSSTLFNQILEHNHADLTAVVQAGVRLSEAQAAFAEKGQMLAADPPAGDEDAATIGGVVATGDSGPMRHRYGAMRDLLVGMKAALPKGTVAASGGKVIKNVAGYDL
ncbi:MAG: FAD-binding oxidoreductase, partial [Actinomycetota bacterium]